MFRTCETWRHKSCLDIDLYVLKRQYCGTKYIKVRGSLVNRFNGIVYETKTWTIQRADLSNWTFVK